MQHETVTRRRDVAGPAGRPRTTTASPARRIAFAVLLSIAVPAGATAWAHGGAFQPPPEEPVPPQWRGSMRGGTDPDDWSRWWYAHRSNLLDFDTRVERNATTTPGGADDAGMWRAEAQLALAEALTDRDEDVSSGAAIALGKAGDPSDAPRLTALLDDRSRQQPVREAAALGLALLGTASHPSSAAATRALERTAADAKEPERLRAICAWSLGLRRDAASVPFLLDLADVQTASRDVSGAATSALGLSGDALVREPLLGWFEGATGRLRKETGRRVHAAHGLAHLGDAAAVPALRAALREDDEDVRRAAVLALGALTPKEDDVTVSLLARALDRDRDRGVRNMAAISLGRIGGKGAERALRWAYAQSDALTQPYAALGLGLLARSTGDASLTVDVRSDLRDRASAGLRGALAVAVGIARDRAAAATLREIVRDRGDPELRAHAALALGLIGDASAADDLRAVLTDTRDPALQREAAMALGLLGDVRSLDVLRGLVSDGSSLYVQGASAMALGRIGGADASKTLSTLLSDRSRAGVARGFAAVGLGYVLDRTAGRGLGRVGTNMDWYFRTPSVDEILTIL